ncbi:MAG: C4-dicarboxylate TRAP transporter substrate-binding protein, partial [Alphaproteobacteria bacterium]
MNNRPIRSKLLATVAGIAILTAAAASSPVQAAETLRLTVLSGYPTGLSWVAGFLEAFKPTVKAELAKTGNYDIDWNEAFSGTVSKPREELEAVSAGLGEVGLVGTVFTPDKLPLYNFPFVTPFSTKDMAVVADAYVNLEKTFPEFAEGWAKFNQVSLSPASVLDNYILFTSRKITQSSDLQGMKIGAAGVNLPWVTSVGATGVPGALPNFYLGLETSLFEGVIIYADAAAKFKLCEPAPYILDAGMGAVNGYSLTVNQDAWDSMPSEVRNAMAKGAVAWREKIMDLVIEGNKAGLEICKTQYGTEVTVVSEEDRKKWAAALP